jgi:hypothetical protein
MQLVHNDALLDSSIYGLARCACSSINSTRPIKHYIMDLLHIMSVTTDSKIAIA